MIANEVPRVSLADTFIDARSFEEPKRNPSDAFVPKRQMGGVTTALRIIVELRSAGSSAAYVQPDD